MIGHGARPLVTADTLDERRDVQRSRDSERQANMELQKAVAEEAMERRSQRNSGSLFERVEKAKERLTPLPAGACLALYEAANTIDRDILFLAEEAGKNRKEILRMWTQPRKSAREQLVQEAREKLQGPPEVGDAAVAAAATDTPPSEPAEKPAPKSRAKPKSA